MCESDLPAKDGFACIGALALRLATKQKMQLSNCNPLEYVMKSTGHPLIDSPPGLHCVEDRAKFLRMEKKWLTLARPVVQ